VAYIILNSKATSITDSKGRLNNLTIQGGLRNVKEIEKACTGYIGSNSVPEHVINKIIQDYYNSRMPNRPDDVFCEDVAYWFDR